MQQQMNAYEVIGKATVERVGEHMSHALKLLYRGDGTPWWTTSSSLDWPVSKEFFDAVKVGDRLTLTSSKL